MAAAFAIRAGCAAACLFGNAPFGRRAQIYSGAARFGQADSNCLFGGGGAVFALADMVHLFAHKFTGLCGSGFALPFITTGPFESLLFWHTHGCRRGTRLLQ